MMTSGALTERGYPDLHDHLETLRGAGLLVVERAAQLAVKGDYFETGTRIAERRRWDVRMNTEIRDAGDGGGRKGHATD